MIQIEGGLSVKAALLGRRRKVDVIYLDETRHDKDARFICYRAEDAGVEVRKVSRSAIDAMAAGRTHGGVIAEAEERNWQKIEEALTDNPFLFLVEGVEDPYNLGYIMRTVYSAGCTGLLVRARDWSRVEGTILRASAGAFEYLNVIPSDDLPSLLRKVKAQGVKTYAAMRRDAIPYWDGSYTGPCLIAVGGEMRGLSARIMAEMDQNIYIPYANDFRAALNAAGACAAIAFEGFRQRKNFHK
jgi:23S rRNA (guanosine2251-2'-O)-methyltransferase